MHISARVFAPRLVHRRGLAPSALEPTSYSESISEAVLIAEAELASEAAGPNPRRNRSSGLEFVLKTNPWRPGEVPGSAAETQNANNN